jgi:hypothetical protein
MNDEKRCFAYGCLIGWCVALAVCVPLYEAVITDMRDKAIARDAAYWETKGGQAVFTWKAEKAEAQR